MAEVVDEMPELNHAGRKQKYPNEWFDGRVWKLTAGVDFEAARAMNVEHYLRARARSMGKRMSAKRDGSCLFIQAHNREKQAEKD
jgi:hypothetical protein